MSALFEDIRAKSDVTADEQAVIDFWESNDIFHKSLNPLDKDGKPKKVWVFYEGPPTANGKPHAGHVLTRVIKDLLPRYKTMCGFNVPRKAGWDTHGLPVEIEVEKALGISGKPDIEKYGVEAFIKKCQESVFIYTKEWEELTRRVGFWIDLSEAYVTYTTDYVESVWWALKTIHEQGLLYRGHKVLPWCPHCETALSSHEVGLGYEDIDDPAITVAFQSADDPGVSFLAWTTTPWTLVSNVALAVGADIDYSYVKLGDDTVVLATALVDDVLGKLGKDVKYETLRTVKGAELVGRTYEPLYNFDPPDKPAWRIIAGDFVTLDTGTGIVHTAPAYGEDDYRACQAEGLPIVHMVNPDGTFRKEAKPFAGKFVKDADKDVIADLRARKRVLRRDTVRHSYPHCWRCKGPLLYFAREAWFIRTTEKVKELLANNSAITWQPEHIKTGRFGKFLETNVDWALSRERFWGTPLPIWVCEKCGREEAFDSLAAIEKRNPEALAYWNERKAADPELNEHLVIHKPFVDHITVPCSECGGTMNRVSEVIDCWFDSGAMPFAQWGYPHKGKDEFDKAFPADWISEAIDQTRGWFYSLLAIGTLLFEDRGWPVPYRSCVVLGHVCDEKGQKYSKHLQNYVAPDEILARVGADALRWFFYSGTAPWNSSRFSERAVQEGRREFLMKLREVTRFFVTYANIDGFNPSEENKSATGTTPKDLKASKGYRPASERGELDRWALAELQSTIQAVRDAMDDLDFYSAARRLQSWVDGLSNWYLRRSRRRFWEGGLTKSGHATTTGGPSGSFPKFRTVPNQEKYDAYWTLYECLATTFKLSAPFTPFQSEQLYQILVRRPWPRSQPESVHLNDFPRKNDYPQDKTLVRRMSLVRGFVQLGHAARASAKIRVRQPLSKAIIIFADNDDPDAPYIQTDLEPIIAEELNVKSTVWDFDPQRYVEYKIVPNFKVIGPKYRRDVKAIKQALAELDGSAAHAELTEKQAIALKLPDKTIELTPGEVEVRLSAREGYVAAQGAVGVVILNTELDAELIAEGLARDINNRVQGFRRDLDLPFEARVKLAISGSDNLVDAARAHAEYLKEEALAVELTFEAPDWPGAESREFEIGTGAITIWLARV